VHYKAHIATLETAINVTASAVIQVKPGIGGVVWHLPFIRAIAAAVPGGQVTFFAPPTSGLPRENVTSNEITKNMPTRNTVNFGAKMPS
jgi:hypothetical protein